jgi:hypothetical protein
MVSCVLQHCFVEDRDDVASLHSNQGRAGSRVLFVQAAWLVLIKPKSWERHGLKSWIEAARKRLHHNVLAIALANKLAGSPGVFLRMNAPSKRANSPRPSFNPPNRREH